MRDPTRIDKFCTKLASYWKSVPDWRFGQLILNVWGQQKKIRDPFFIEDDEMAQLFDQCFETWVPHAAKNTGDAQ